MIFAPLRGRGSDVVPVACWSLLGSRKGEYGMSGASQRHESSG